MKILFYRDVGTLISGTLLAQLINLLAYAVLTRTYSTEAFGNFAIFLSTATIVGTVACLRFDIVVQAAPFAQRRVAHVIGTRFAALISLVLALLYVAVAPPSGWATLATAALLGIATFLTGYTLSGQALLVKHKRYRTTATTNVARTLLTAAPQIGFFWLLPGPFGLMLGYCVGAAVQAAMQRQALQDVPRRNVSKRRMRAMLRRYRMYPIYDLPSALLATASLFAGNYLVFALYGAASAGLYAMAFRLITLPLALIGSNLSEVFFQRASLAYEQRQPIWPFMRLALLVAGGLAIAAAIATTLLAPPVIDFYLGSEWSAVAELMIALTPLMALRLLSLSVGSTPLVLRRPQWLLIHSAALLAVLLLSALMASIWELDLFAFLWLSSISSAAVYALFVLVLIATVAGNRYDAKVARSSSTRG
jgi:O-antigen/teichoic acid export membrane protein